MAFLERIRVQNYRALRDVTLGKVSDDGSAESLTPLTAVIGKNGVGKSTRALSLIHPRGHRTRGGRDREDRNA